MALGEPMPLNTQAYPCNYSVPANGTVDGYPKLANCSCNYCQDMCEPPDVTSSIGFFDGFDTKVAWIVVGSVIGFSILWQLFVCRSGNAVDEEIERLGLHEKIAAEARDGKV